MEVVTDTKSVNGSDQADVTKVIETAIADTVKSNISKDDLPAAVEAMDKVINGFGQLEMESVPDRFLCPLTSKVMKEPVVIESGLVFEKEAVSELLKENGSKCPLTNATVNSDVLIPVTPLKREIRQWKSSKQGFDDNLSTVSGHSSLEREALAELVGELHTITRSLSQHLESAKSLSRSLSSMPSRRGLDAEGDLLDEGPGFGRELSRKVSKLTVETGKHTQKLFEGLCNQIAALIRVTSEIVGTAVSQAVPASRAVAHNVGRAAEHVKVGAGKAAHSVAGGAVEVLHVVKTNAGPVFVSTYENIGPTVTAARNRVGSATIATRNAVFGAAGAVKHHTGNFGPAFVSTYENIGPTFTAARNGVGSATIATRNAVFGAAGAVKHHTGNFRVSCRGHAIKLGNGVKCHTTRAVYGAGRFIGPKVDAAARHVGNALQSAQQAAAPAISGVQHHVGTAAKTMSEKALPVAAAVQGHVVKAASGVQHHVGNAVADVRHHAGRAAAGLNEFMYPAVAAVQKHWAKLPPQARAAACPVALFVGINLLCKVIGAKQVPPRERSKPTNSKSATSAEAVPADGKHSNGEFDFVKVLMQVYEVLHVEEFLHHVRVVLSEMQHTAQGIYPLMETNFHKVLKQVKAPQEGSPKRLSLSDQKKMLG